MAKTRTSASKSFPLIDDDFFTGEGNFFSSFLKVLTYSDQITLTKILNSAQKYIAKVYSHTSAGDTKELEREIGPMPMMLFFVVLLHEQHKEILQLRAENQIFREAMCIPNAAGSQPNK